jgi:hypothetical protein
LQPTAAKATAHDQPFVTLTRLRIRSPGAEHDRFRLLRADAMLGDMVDVPGVPAEFHGGSPPGILPYKKIFANGESATRWFTVYLLLDCLKMEN